MRSETSNALSAQIKQARIKAGLTQKELAELTGLTQVYISQLENGKVEKLQMITREKLERIIEI